MTDTYNLDVILRAKQEGMSALKNTENGLAGIAKAGALLAVVLATAVVTGAVAAYAKTEALGQAAYEMGEKFGLSGHQASQWIAVAEQLGLSSESVGTAFKFLSKNAEAMTLTLESHKKISAVTLQVYKDVGIHVLDAGGKVKSLNQLLLESADYFHKHAGAAGNAGMAIKLFGRSGSDLLPMLELGKQGLLDYMASGQKLGTVMSTDQVNAWHKAFLAHKEFDTALQGVTTRIGTAVMPLFTRLFNYMVNIGIPAVSKLAAFVGPYLGAAWDAVSKAALYFWPTLQQIGNYIKDHAWPAIVQLWSAFTTLLAPAIKYIKDHFDDFKVVLIAVAIVVGVAIAAIVISLALFWGAVIGLVAAVVWLYESFKANFPRALNAIDAFVVGGIKNFQRFKQWLQDLPGQLAADAVNLGRKLVASIVSGLQAAGGAIMAAIKSLMPGGANGPVVLALHAAGVPGFQFGGTVPGQTGSPQLIIAHGGETVVPEGRGGTSTGSPTIVHVHIAGAVFLDNGPSMDRFAMALANRLSYVTGR